MKTEEEKEDGGRRRNDMPVVRFPRLDISGDGAAAGTAVQPVKI